MMNENEELNQDFDTTLSNSIDDNDTNHDVDFLEEVLACLAGTN